MPAVIAGHRNASLHKEFSQGEANFTCSNKTDCQRITPFPVVTRVLSAVFCYALISFFLSVQFPLLRNTIRLISWVFLHITC